MYIKPVNNLKTIDFVVLEICFYNVMLFHKKMPSCNINSFNFVIFCGSLANCNRDDGIGDHIDTSFRYNP